MKWQLRKKGCNYIRTLGMLEWISCHNIYAGCKYQFHIFGSFGITKWAYIIMNHDFITIWDHDPGGEGVSGICVCSSWPEYWLHKLHILQVYHIMPPIDADEIFCWYHLYFLTGSHFAQILKMALLSMSLNLQPQYLSRLWTHLRLPIAKKLFIWFT